MGRKMRGRVVMGRMSIGGEVGVGGKMGDGEVGGAEGGHPRREPGHVTVAVQLVRLQIADW